MTGDTTAPPPQGHYAPARRLGQLIFTAGMTPRRNGVLVATVPIRVDAPLDSYRDVVVLACANALAAARSTLTPGESLSAILSLTVYVAAEPGFVAHSRIADFASAFLAAELGEGGVASRAAVGVASLPSDAPVEIQLIAAV